MDIHVKELIENLKNSELAKQQDVSPEDALYIKLGEKKGSGKTITYQSDSVTIVLDIDKEGMVYGMELV